jgi:hypothetical protein
VQPKSSKYPIFRILFLLQQFHDLRRSALTSFAPRHDTLGQACKLVRTTLKMSPSPPHDMLGQACKLVRTTLKMSPSPPTRYVRPSMQTSKHDAENVSESPNTMTRSSRSTIVLRFGSKAPLKKLKRLTDLSLSLTRGP